MDNFYKFGWGMFIFLLISLSFVNAAPPFIEPVASINGLQIAYPATTHYLMGSNLTLNYHVYNSTGFILDNTTVSCSIDIYNQKGDEIISDLLTYNDYDFYYFFNYSAFSCCVNYQWIVSCESDVEAGFIEGGFQINKIGQEPDQNNTLFSLLFIFTSLIAIGGFGMLIYSKSKYAKLMYANISALFVMLTTMVLYWTVDTIYPLAFTLKDNITNYYNWATYLFWITLLISLILLVIFYLLDMVKKRKAKEKGLWDQYN
jgi:hypothetical protein